MGANENLTRLVGNQSRRNFKNIGEKYLKRLQYLNIGYNGAKNIDNKFIFI
jgi:hypothetical protein